MAKIITARFRNDGIPQTGLTPTIDIYEVVEAGADVNVVNDAAMTEIGNGWYKFVFTDGAGFDPRKDYIYDADGGVSISSPFERFQEGACCAAEPEVNADATWEADQSLYLDINTMGGRHNATFNNVQQLLLDVNDVFNLVNLVRKYDTNRTRIDPTAKTLTVFEDDGTTPLQVFTLRDSSGTPSVDPACERDPQ